MTDITFVGAAKATGNQAADLTLDISGTGVADGDIVVVISGAGYTAAESAKTLGGRIGNSQSYTEIANLWKDNGISVGNRTHVAWHIWHTGDTTSITIECDTTAINNNPSFGALNAVGFVFRTVDANTPIDVTTITANGSSTNPNCGAITPANNNCCILAGATSAVNDSSPGTVTNYTEPTNFCQNTSGISTSMTTAMAYRILTGGAGSPEDPAAFSSWSSGQWNAVTIALRPAVPLAKSGFGIII